MMRSLRCNSLVAWPRRLFMYVSRFFNIDSDTMFVIIMLKLIQSSSVCISLASFSPSSTTWSSADSWSKFAEACIWYLLFQFQNAFHIHRKTVKELGRLVYSTLLLNVMILVSQFVNGPKKVQNDQKPVILIIWDYFLHQTNWVYVRGLFLCDGFPK